LALPPSRRDCQKSAAGARRGLRRGEVAMLDVLLKIRREIANKYKKIKRTKQGNGTISLRLSILEEHNQMIQREISRLHETQKIIEYKIDLYREISENPDLNDTNCNPTISRVSPYL
jgi:hypothetical protein